MSARASDSTFFYVDIVRVMKLSTYLLTYVSRPEESVPYLIKHINALERVQKHFTKRIHSLSNLSYSERLAALDLEPLELRRLKSDLVLYFICLHDLVALPCSDYFTMSNDTSQAPTGNRLLRPLYSTKHFENDFFHRCVSCWNFDHLQW